MTEQEKVDQIERIAAILRFIVSEHGADSVSGAVLIGAEFSTGVICGVPCFNAPTSISKLCNVGSKVANDFDNFYGVIK